MVSKQDVGHKNIVTDINCYFSYSQCQNKRLFHTLNVCNVDVFVGSTKIATSLHHLIGVVAELFLTVNTGMFKTK